MLVLEDSMGDIEKDLRVTLNELEKRKFKNRDDYYQIKSIRTQLEEITGKKLNIINQFKKQEDLADQIVPVSNEFESFCNGVLNQCYSRKSYKKKLQKKQESVKLEKTDFYHQKFETSMLALYDNITQQSIISADPYSCEISNLAKPEYFSVFKEKSLECQEERISILRAQHDLIDFEINSEIFENEKLCYKDQQAQKDQNICKKRHKEASIVIQLIDQNFDNLGARKVASLLQSSQIHSKLKLEYDSFLQVAGKISKMSSKKENEKDEMEVIKDSQLNEYTIHEIHYDQLQKHNSDQINEQDNLDKNDTVTPKLIVINNEIKSYMISQKGMTRFIKQKGEHGDKFYWENVRQLALENQSRNISPMKANKRISVMDHLTNSPTDKSKYSISDLETKFKNKLVTDIDNIIVFFKEQQQSGYNQATKYNILQEEYKEKSDMNLKLRETIDGLRKESYQKVINHDKKNNSINPGWFDNTKVHKRQSCFEVSHSPNKTTQQLSMFNQIQEEPENDDQDDNFSTMTMHRSSKQLEFSEEEISEKKLDEQSSNYLIDEDELLCHKNQSESLIVRHKSIEVKKDQAKRDNPLDISYQNRMIPQVDWIKSQQQFFMKLTFSAIMIHLRLCSYIDYIADNTDMISSDIFTYSKNIQVFLSRITYKEDHLQENVSSFTTIEEYMSTISEKEKRETLLQENFSTIKPENKQYEIFGVIENIFGNKDQFWSWFIINCDLLEHMFTSNDIGKIIMNLKRFGQDDLSQICKNLVLDIHKQYTSNISKLFNLFLNHQQRISVESAKIKKQVKQSGIGQVNKSLIFNVSDSHRTPIKQKKNTMFAGHGRNTVFTTGTRHTPSPQKIKRKSDAHLQTQNLRMMNMAPDIDSIGLFEPFTAPIGRNFKYGPECSIKRMIWRRDSKDFDINQNMKFDETLNTEEREKITKQKEDEEEERPYLKESLKAVANLQKSEKKKKKFNNILHNISQKQDHCSIQFEDKYQDIWLKTKQEYGKAPTIRIGKQDKILKDKIARADNEDSSIFSNDKKNDPDLLMKSAIRNENYEAIENLSKIRLKETMPLYNKPYFDRAHLVNNLYKGICFQPKKNS